MGVTARSGPARWLLPVASRPDAEVLMFCLPYAGGSAATFRRFAALTQRLDVEVRAVELPGHGRRIGEPPAFVVADVADVVSAVIDRPYILFGHSLGARLAFEVARHLRDGGAPEPLRLFVSGSPGPRLPRVGMGDAALPDDEFIARIEAMGGTPAAVLGDAELREMFLPVMRADFAWGDTYQYRSGRLLDCPVTAFAGAADPEAPVDQVATWALETTGPYRTQVLAGGHFFLHEQFDALADALVSDLPELGSKGTRSS